MSSNLDPPTDLRLSNTSLSLILGGMAREKGQPNPNKGSPSITTTIHDLGIDIDSIPKLAANGSNWGIYRLRMDMLLGVLRLADHLTNSKMPNSGAGAETHSLDSWEHDDLIVQRFIATSIPDDDLKAVQKGTSAKHFWDILEARFAFQARCICSRLTRELYDQRCSNDDDIRGHLDKLFSLWGQLLVAGGLMSDNEFSYLILDSLPDAYCGIVSGCRIAAILGGKSHNLSPYDVRILVTGPYARSQAPESSNRTRRCGSRKRVKQRKGNA